MGIWPQKYRHLRETAAPHEDASSEINAEAQNSYGLKANL